MSDKIKFQIKVLQFPFGTRSAFFLTSDDLNPAFIGEREKLYLKPALALENLIKAGQLLAQNKFHISYGFVPEYSCEKNDSSYQIANFKESCFNEWNIELKEQIRKGLCSLFAHSRYHLNDFAKPSGGFEEESDWAYVKEVIEKIFSQTTFTFRSPGYQCKKSENWSYSDYIRALKKAGYLILLDKSYGFYHPNDLNYLCEEEEPNKLKKYDILSIRKLIPERAKFILKKVIGSSKKSYLGLNADSLFSIGTYRDIEFNKGQYNNAYERLKLSYKRGDFIQESILYIYFHLKGYWEILEKIADFISSKGTNTFNGIWQPKTAEEIKNWFDLVALKNYNIKIEKKKEISLIKIESPLKFNNNLITLKIAKQSANPIKLNIDTKSVLKKEIISNKELLITLNLNNNPFIFEIL